MIFVFDFSTPALTLVTAKKKTDLRLAQGTIYAIEIVIPPGPMHLSHLQINDALHQLWPTNPDADIAGDNEILMFNDTYELDQPPYELQAYTWNEDEVYPHRFIIRIGLKPPERALPPIVTGQVPEELGGILF